ncbi:MAG: acyl-CoA dehydrogenase C-terminal domain-containing protein [Ectothiorhodospiraceae bacterium]|nr:acyl-CoA dehydrogenase C-terminal domain-containing protein [Chromatiales bacterium]MCP5154646.1 acyl-CoA dehydrogenase C-terminal domain-containing protein [Ectothiorhodospiraceae bacterium]
MAIYKAPLRDMRFVLHEMLDIERHLAGLDGCEDATAETIDAVLAEAARICEEVVLPTNASGDEAGCTLEDGAVRTPPGFAAAYHTLREGGWFSLGCDPAYGGQGLPHTLAVFFEEILQSSNLAFSLYPGLTRGAYMALHHHASDALKAAWMPRLVSGEWSAVMCLTEPHCGTDLGLLRTRAERADDGTYRISGTKIFITGGDQDMTDNIVHLVLARLTDAPAGTRGISMFLVPKFLLDASGEPGERNSLGVGSIEKKMGIKGASTCVMNYEGATGWLVGEENRGLNAMFSMMNHERLMVGQQGLALGEVAYQSAAAYARERLQGRSLGGAKSPEQAADPIIVHPDVRRMLLTARAYNEGARALFGWVSLQVDRMERHPDPAVREAAGDLVALLTPVVKAIFTDNGSEACNLCLQVLGGHGYIREWGMEQLVRDARIAQIYEGANGIHALDLVGRKLQLHGGRLLDRYLQECREFLTSVRDRDDAREFVDPLAEALVRLEEASAWLRGATARDPEEIGAASYDYMRLLALVAFGHMWARAAIVALDARNGDNSGFYESKIHTARFFVRRLLPQTASLLATLRAGADTLMDMPAEAF